jgi:predicted RNA-binding protein with TRAM domain
MTRQNVTEGPREILTQKCPTCAGDGIVLSTHSAAIDVERRLRALAAGSKRGVEAIRVELEEHVASHLVGPGASRLMEIEALAKRRFYLEGKADAPLDHFKVLAEGKLVDIAPTAPVEEGAEIRLELVEVGKHDLTAGMGKVDGLDVCIADAAKLVGKKVKVRVERVLDGIAYGTLVQTAAEKAVEGPITAEAEAEKPTRAPRKKVEAKAEAPAPEKEEGPVAQAVDEAVEAIAEEGEELPTDESPAGESDGEAKPDVAAPPKKRTRRGSRGGRNRRKKPAAAAAAENGQPPAERTPKPAREPETAPVATIHVPSPDLGQDGEASAGGDQPPKKKRTRRGSRGGRNRRKKPAAAAAEAKPESTD